MRGPALFLLLLAALCSADAVSRRSSHPRRCAHSATSRGCWGGFSVDTNYYTDGPNTGVTREYWLSAQNVTCAPDGYTRYCLTFNGTVPGPVIRADWGDTVIVHVTNNLQENGTSVHWHGLRQVGTSDQDGVPGVNQCPIAPGTTQTYVLRATQYGTAWYHSHFGLQYADGMFGALIINGPATANYDEDAGPIFGNIWSHTEMPRLWANVTKAGRPPTIDNALINGMHTWDCSVGNAALDPNCKSGGKRFELSFKPGKKYRLRIINSSIDGRFQFSIDGHRLLVIANDLVPIVPFETDNLFIVGGQRYDVIVEANAQPANYWMRFDWNQRCATLGNTTTLAGIVRYPGLTSGDPTSSSGVALVNHCGEHPLSQLVPHLALDVDRGFGLDREALNFSITDRWRWSLGSSSLHLDWTHPTISRTLKNQTPFPDTYNVRSIDNSANQFAVIVVENKAGRVARFNHPIHLHGHDFWVLAQFANRTFDGTAADFNFKNPPRRDVANLPGNGYLALAFRVDNPGVWLLHCHIAWHSGQGLALQLVEREKEIAGLMSSQRVSATNELCRNWEAWKKHQDYPEDESGV